MACQARVPDDKYIKKEHNHLIVSDCRDTITRVVLAVEGLMMI